MRGSVAFNGALIPIDDGMFSEHLKNVLHLSILYRRGTAPAFFSLIEVARAGCRSKPFPLFTLRFRFKNVMIFSCGFGTRGDNPRGGKRNGWKMLQEFSSRGILIINLFFHGEEAGSLSTCRHPRTSLSYGAERHFQPSKSSPALWRLPKEVILLPCSIPAPGCASWWLF